MTATFYGNVFAFLLCAPLAFPVRAAGPVDWAVIGYLGCFQLALAYILLTRGIGKLSALEASLLLLLEPALNPLWTFLVHGETPGVIGSVGGGLVLWPPPPARCALSARANELRAVPWSHSDELDLSSTARVNSANRAAAHNSVPTWRVDSRIGRYGLAVLAVMAAALCRWLLVALDLGANTTFGPFYAATVLAALYGGFGAGLLALGLSAAATIALWATEPARSTIAPVSIVVFLMVGGLIVWLTPPDADRAACVPSMPSIACNRCSTASPMPSWPSTSRGASPTSTRPPTRTSASPPAR